MNKIKNLNLIISALAITGVSVNSATTSLANNGGLFTKNTTNSNKYNIDWVQKVGDKKEDKFYEIIPTKDKGYLAVGQASFTETTGFTTGDAIIVKYDKNGNEVWRDVLQGDETDRYYSVLELNDGRFIAFEKGFEIFFYDLFHKKIISESLNIMYFEEINTDESLIPTIPIPYFPTKFYGNIHFFNKDCHIILFFRECYDEIADTFGKVKIEKYNILTGATEELDINEPGNIISCAISQNDELIAFCYKDGKILIWNNCLLSSWERNG